MRPLIHAIGGLPCDQSGGNSTENSPKLTIGAYPNTATGALPEAMARLRADSPRLHFKLVTGLDTDLIDALQNRAVDVVLGREPAIRQLRSLVFEPLYTEVLAFVVRPQHPLAFRSQLYPPDLASYPVRIPSFDSILIVEAQRYLSTQGLPPGQPVAREHLLVPYPELVAHDDSILIAPLGAVSGAIDVCQMVRLPLDRRVPGRDVGVLYIPASPMRHWIVRLTSQLQACTPGVAGPQGP